MSAGNEFDFLEKLTHLWGVTFDNDNEVCASWLCPLCFVSMLKAFLSSEITLMSINVLNISLIFA